MKMKHEYTIDLAKRNENAKLVMPFNFQLSVSRQWHVGICVFKLKMFRLKHEI